MRKQSVDKCISDLEKKVGKTVGMVMELKKNEKQWQQKKTEIEKRLKNLLRCVEELSDEKES